METRNGHGNVFLRSAGGGSNCKKCKGDCKKHVWHGDTSLPVISSEGDGREPFGVVEITDGIIRPAIADGFGRWDIRRADDNGVIANNGVGPDELFVATSDSEAAKRTATSHKATARVGKGEDDVIIGKGCLVEDGAGEDERLTVGNVAGGEGETMGDILFIFGVDIVGIIGVSEINCAGHRGVGDAEGEGLGFTEVGPGGVSLYRIGLRGEEIGELDVKEGELGITPAGAPVGDERGEERAVSSRVMSVGFALVPKNAPQAKGDERMDHGVEERRGLMGIVERIVEARGRRWGRLGSARACDGITPCGEGVKILAAGFLRVVLTKLFIVVFEALGHEGNFFQSGAARPGFNGRAAPGGVNDRDGNAKVRLQFTGEEVSDGGEIRYRGGRAYGPCYLSGWLRLECHSVVNGSETDKRIRGGRDFRGSISGAAHGPFHIRLTGAEPDVANEDVGEDTLGTRTRDNELPRFIIGSKGADSGPPVTRGIGGSHNRLATELDGNFFLRLCPAPNGETLITLEDHMVIPDSGKAWGGSKDSGHEDGRQSEGVSK